MKKETERIRDQMARAHAGEPWLGTSAKDVLDGIDAATAAARPIVGANSIWQIVLHLVTTQELVLRRFDGEAASLNEEGFWPPVGETDAGAWKALVDRFHRNEERLREAIVEFPDEKLDEPMFEGSSSAYDNAHGNVQHNLYHLAQIGLLKKAAQAGG